MNATRYFVYVLRNNESRLYVGFTSDLDKRVQQHQEEKAGWTRGRGPWELVYYETYTDRSLAMSRERSLKSGRENEELRKVISRLNGRAGPS
jgi:putative endonuclease